MENGVESGISPEEVSPKFRGPFFPPVRGYTFLNSSETDNWFLSVPALV